MAHAHNDYLQLLIETGRTGLGLFSLGLVAGLFSYVRSGGLRHAVALTLLGASGITCRSLTLSAQAEREWFPFS
ncbi:MAG: hypothetical protein J6386_12965 [Candidatus Synoicihabitans palmerolidicus]|nr:hypothetical protein [Candidatus Synoicihabitans palmerolidicus]